jgi:hypothetical protein
MSGVGLNEHQNTQELIQNAERNTLIQFNSQRIRQKRWSTLSITTQINTNPYNYMKL